MEPCTSACIVLPHPDVPGQLLGVSRGLHSPRWGLPGGHREANESPAGNAARELREETGLRALHLEPVGIDVTMPGQVVAVFLCRSWSGRLLSASPEGDVAWVSWPVLFAGPFGKSNREIYRRLRG